MDMIARKHQGKYFILFTQEFKNTVTTLPAFRNFHLLRLRWKSVTIT